MYQKLSDRHLYPNGADLMNNALAEEMLNSDALHLLKSFQSSVEDGSYLNSTIKLRLHLI